MAETRRRIPLRTRPSSAIQGGQSNLNLRTCPGVQLDLRGRSGGQSDSSSDDEDALDKLEGDFRRQHLERYSVSLVRFILWSIKCFCKGNH